MGHSLKWQCSTIIGKHSTTTKHLTPLIPEHIYNCIKIYITCVFALVYSKCYTLLKSNSLCDALTIVHLSMCQTKVTFLSIPTVSHCLQNVPGHIFKMHQLALAECIRYLSCSLTAKECCKFMTSGVKELNEFDAAWTSFPSFRHIHISTIWP